MAEKEKQHSVNTKIPASLHRALRMRAAKEDKKLREVFLEALTAAMEAKK